MQKSLPTYYIWYANDGEIYAYTDDRDLADAFTKLRKKSEFIRKKFEMKSDDLRGLHESYPEAMLQWATYTLGDMEVTLPVTKMENVTVIHYCIQSAVVDIPLLASIDPRLFTKDVQDALRDLGYIDAWNLVNGYDEYKKVKPNYLQCFLYLYGNTIEWGKGGSIYENLCILSDRRKHH